MIKSLKSTSLYKSLNLMKNLHNAYLFSSLDRELNNEVATLFGKELLCENRSACDKCSACMQFSSQSHPDLILLNKPSIKVEDISILIEKLNTMPISSSKKVFIVFNAENINEIAQNKMLKSLEDLSSNNIFVLTTSKIDKLLPTILSRLHKVSLPKLSKEDKLIISDELKQSNIQMDKYINSGMNLTEILNFETNENYLKTLKAIKFIFENLNSSQDIPLVSSSIPDYDKQLLLPLLQKLFLSCINDEIFVDNDLKILLNSKFSTQVLINCLPHIEESYKKQMSNVNLSYILDNLLFIILKEKFLCKQ